MPFSLITLTNALKGMEEDSSKKITDGSEADVYSFHGSGLSVQVDRTRLSNHSCRSAWRIASFST